MAKEYIKVYTSKEYRDSLNKLQDEGYYWGSGGKLVYKNGRPSIPFKYPIALVVYEDKFVYIDEIRHCPDPSDRRLEATNLKVGDKVVLNDKYAEYESHKGEVFEITKLQMFGLIPCAFLSPSGLGLYACDGLKRV